MGLGISFAFGFGIVRASFCDFGFAIEHGQHGQLVALTNFVIVRVVAGRDLHAPRAELGLDQQAVRDDRNRPIHQRQQAVRRN